MVPGLLRQCETRFGQVLLCFGFTAEGKADILGVLLWGEFDMQKKLSGLLAAGLVVTGMLAASGPMSAQTKEGSKMPKVGDVAPDFTLKYFDGSDLKDVKLSEYHGKKNVVLAFYIFAFTGG
jgi:hypothetical protein